MTKSIPALLVAIADHTAIVKICGRANFTTSVHFKKLLTELEQRGFDRFMLELSECLTMDSTFLGVLAGTALRLSAVPPGQTDAHVQLLNPNQRVSELLDNLGIAHLFPILSCPSPTPGPYDDPARAPAEPTREELSRTCLEAHRVLMDVNPKNIPKFKDVAQFLAEDLKKLDEERTEDSGATIPNDAEGPK